MERFKNLWKERGSRRDFLKIVAGSIVTPFSVLNWFKIDDANKQLAQIDLLIGHQTMQRASIIPLPLDDTKENETIRAMVLMQNERELAKSRKEAEIDYKSSRGKAVGDLIISWGNLSITAPLGLYLLFSGSRSSKVKIEPDEIYKPISPELLEDRGSTRLDWKSNPIGAFKRKFLGLRIPKPFKESLEE